MQFPEIRVDWFISRMQEKYRSVVSNNPTLDATITKIQNWLQEHYLLLLAATAIWTLVSNPISFFVGSAVGLWAAKRRFLAISDEMKQGEYDEYATEDLPKNPALRLGFLVSAIAIKLLIEPHVASLSIGLLVGIHLYYSARDAQKPPMPEV